MGTEPWIAAIMGIFDCISDRGLYAQKIKDAGYDIRHSSEMLENIYCNRK